MCTHKKFVGKACASGHSSNLIRWNPNFAGNGQPGNRARVNFGPK